MANPLRKNHSHSEFETEGNRALASLLKLRLRLRGARTEETGQDAPLTPQDTSPDPDALASFVGGEIIPRLMLAHQLTPDAAEAPTPELGPETHEHFLQVVLEGSESETREFIDLLVEDGVSLETIFLDLLTNTARRLGELWETDERSFGDVTLGLLRLHRILRERRLDEGPRMRTRFGGRQSRVMMVSACGDQHVFGLLMVSEFFRNEGWWVCSEPGTDPRLVEDMLAKDAFDVLGVTASCTTLVDRIGTEIARYRAASCNREMKVLVGGGLFADTPELVSKVGADAAALDPRKAVETAGALMGRAMLDG